MFNSPTIRHRFRFAGAISVMAIYFLVLAVTLSGVWLALLWPAVAFFAIAIGYASLGERVFGKEDGRVRTTVKVLLAPWLILQFATWWLQGKLSAEPWFHRIGRHYLGRYPSPGNLPDDVDLVVDLTAEFDRPTLPARVRYVSLPMLDACAAAQEPLRALLAEIEAHDGVAYVHCASGHGRSGMVHAALLLSAGRAADSREAEAELKSHRPGVRLSIEQHRALEKLFAP